MDRCRLGKSLGRFGSATLQERKVPEDESTWLLLDLPLARPLHEYDVVMGTHSSQPNRHGLCAQRFEENQPNDSDFCETRTC